MMVEQKSMIKEELIVSSLSDDSDVEVIIYNNLQGISCENDSKQSTKDLFCDEEEPFILRLSDSSDNEEKTHRNIKDTSKIKNINTKSDAPSTDGERSFETYSDNSVDLSPLSNTEMKLDFQSDEECIFYDFPDYSAGGYLKTGENNKSLNDEKVVKLNIKKSEESEKIFSPMILDVQSISGTNPDDINGNTSNFTIKEVTTVADCNSTFNKTDNKSEDSFDLTSTLDDSSKTLISDSNTKQITSINGSSIFKKTDMSIKKFNTILDIPKVSEAVQMYCQQCNRVNKVDDGGLRTFCTKCRLLSWFQCIKCKSTFYSLHQAKHHLKHCLHSLEKNCVNNYVPNRFSTKKCVKCGELISESQIEDHIIQEHEGSFEMKDLPGIINNITKRASAQKDTIDQVTRYCENRNVKMSTEQDQCQECQEAEPILDKAFSVRQCTVEGSVERVCGETESILGKSLKVEQCTVEGSADRPIRLDDDNDSFMCNRCNRVFCSEKEAKRHRQICIGMHSGTALRCVHCSYEGKSIDDLIGHIALIHPKKAKEEYRCAACNRSFKLVRWFRVHLEGSCRKIYLLRRCAHCTYRSFNKSKLKVHLRCNHIHVFTGKLFKCAKCGTKWSSIYRLNDHMNDCSGVYSIERNNQYNLKKKRRSF